MNLKHSLILICFLLILIYGCTSDTEYVAPAKVSAPVNIQKQPETQSPTPSEPEKQPEPPKIQIFKVGETATDNQLKITINSVKFTSTINERGNEFLVATAPSGKQFAIIDITVENVLPDKTQSVSTLVETTIVDQDGYTYDLGFEALTALDKGFKDGEILPNMKNRGQIGFLVPSDATDLKFIYKFDLFTGTSAIFDIK